MSELLRTVGGMRDFVKPKGAIKKSTNAVSGSHSRTSSSVEDDARRIQKNAWVCCYGYIFINNLLMLEFVL